MPNSSPLDNTHPPQSNKPIARTNVETPSLYTSPASDTGDIANAPDPKSAHDDLLSAMTPYLTCQRCNSVTFVDVQRVRRKADQLSASDEIEDTTYLYEQVPQCPGCGSTRYLRAGVVSFQGQIEEARNAIKEFERRRGPATALLQRIARGFLGRLEFRRRLVERERYLRKIKRAATRIQTRIRGMQARRRTLIERCLQVIRFMALPILSYALASRPNEPPVFWYTHTAELGVFYWNYREYVRRSGGRPTLIKVENNVLEITRRVLRREHALVSRIQAQWRGLTTRIVFREFKQQKGWLKGIRQSPAVKIQRLVRGVTSRRRCRALQVTTKYPTQREAYRREIAVREQQTNALAFRQRLMAKYKQQFQINRTTRMLVEQPIKTSTLSKTAVKYGVNLSDEGDEEELGPETHSHVQHSLNNSNGSSANSGKVECGGANPPRSANAVRFAQIKRQLEGKRRRPRDPRLHILKAELYTKASTPQVPVDDRQC